MCWALDVQGNSIPGNDVTGKNEKGFWIPPLPCVIACRLSEKMDIQAFTLMIRVRLLWPGCFSLPVYWVFIGLYIYFPRLPTNRHDFLENVALLVVTLLICIYIYFVPRPWAYPSKQRSYRALLNLACSTESLSLSLSLFSWAIQSPRSDIGVMLGTGHWIECLTIILEGPSVNSEQKRWT